MNNHAFISYSSSEYQAAANIRQVLTQYRVTCWMAPESIPPGSNYAAEIAGAISGCFVFVLVLSEKSQQSPHVEKELNLAINSRKPVIPFHIDHSEVNAQFNYFLTNVQRISACDRMQAAYGELIRTIQQISGQQPASPYGGTGPAQAQGGMSRNAAPAQYAAPVTTVPVTGAAGVEKKKSRVPLIIAISAAVVLFLTLVIGITVFLLSRETGTGKQTAGNVKTGDDIFSVLTGEDTTGGNTAGDTTDAGTVSEERAEHTEGVPLTELTPNIPDSWFYSVYDKQLSFSGEEWGSGLSSLALISSKENRVLAEYDIDGKYSYFSIRGIPYYDGFSDNGSSKVSLVDGDTGRLLAWKGLTKDTKAFTMEADVTGVKKLQICGKATSFCHETWSGEIPQSQVLLKDGTLSEKLPVGFSADLYTSDMLFMDVDDMSEDCYASLAEAYTVSGNTWDRVIRFSTLGNRLNYTKIWLGGNYSRFTGKVGMPSDYNSENQDAGDVDLVFLDEDTNEVLWSHTLSKTMDVADIDVDLTGVNNLMIQVDARQNSFTYSRFFYCLIKDGLFE